MFSYFVDPFIKVIIALILLSSCSQTTTIYSDPKGAKVFIDNVYVGKTPYVHVCKRSEAKNQSIKLVLESPPAKKLSTIDKIKMFEKMSKEGKISKKRFNEYRYQTEMKKVPLDQMKKSPWNNQKVSKKIEIPNYKKPN
tara:strand:- start:24 stop:440 length:417 start_codon:yes stop_codon:yes gene_type:complete